MIHLYLTYLDMETFKERCKKIMEFADQEEFDEYAEQNLNKKLYSWKENFREPIASLDYFVNGKEYSSLMEALYKEEVLSKIKINFLKPSLSGKWNFSKPTQSIMERSGKALLRTLDFKPDSLNPWANARRIKEEKVMLRAYISDFYVPMSIQTKSRFHHAQEIPRQFDPHLKKMAGLWRDVRRGVIPFEIYVCAYTPKDRYIYVINVMGDAQMPHPLHKIPYHHKVDRPPLEYMIFDTVIAHVEFPELVKKMWLFIFECGETTVPDLAHKFNVPNQIAQNNLNAMISKNLISVRKDIYYNVNMEEVNKRASKLSNI